MTWRAKSIEIINLEAEIEVIKSRIKELKKTSFINLKFGRLTVIKTENRQYGAQQRNFAWCQCECGNKFWFRLDHLKSGNTQSCGCLKAENMIWVRHHAWRGVGRAQQVCL